MKSATSSKAAREAKKQFPNILWDEGNDDACEKFSEHPVSSNDQLARGIGLHSRIGKCASSLPSLEVTGKHHHHAQVGSRHLLVERQAPFTIG